MIKHSEIFSKWKKFITNDNDDPRFLITEISDHNVNKILDFVGNADPEDIAFGDLFDQKMRITIPLPFDPSSLDDESLENFTEIMTTVKRQGYTVDEESFKKGLAYKMAQPPDFGTELNLKRYGKESPPGPKKKEMKIGRIVSKNKNLTPEQKKWWSDNAGGLTPQYTAVLTRYPVDVLRMSDFKGIQSCHSEGGEYFKCALAEAHGHGFVAFAVSTKHLNNFLEGNPIEDFDDEEIFKDEDRNIEGLPDPRCRIRLRRVENVSGDYDLAIPELRFYGNPVPDFLDTINNWALENQVHKIHPEMDYEESEIFKNPRWWEKYSKEIQDLDEEMAVIYNESEAHQLYYWDQMEEEWKDAVKDGGPNAFRGGPASREALEAAQKEMREGETTKWKDAQRPMMARRNELQEEYTELTDKLAKYLPPASELRLRGGDYKDSPGYKMLASFFGLKKYLWNKKEHKLEDHSEEYEIDIDMQALAKDVYTTRHDIQRAPDMDARYADDEDEENGLEQRIHEHNEEQDMLDGETSGLTHFHCQVQDLEEYGYDIHELAEDDRLFHIVTAQVSFEIDEEEFEDAENEMPTDWRETQDLASELLDALDEFEIYGDHDFGIDDYGGEFRFYVDFMNDDHNWGTTYNDARMFIQDIQEKDEQYEEMEMAIRERLMELGYMGQNEYYSFRAKLKEGDIEFKNFDFDVERGVITLTATKNLGFSEISGGEIMAPDDFYSDKTHPFAAAASWKKKPINLFYPRRRQPEGPGGERNWADSDEPDPIMLAAVNRDINAAIEYAKKQLSLFDVEAEQETLLKPFTTPGKLRILLRTERNPGGDYGEEPKQHEGPDWSVRIPKNRQWKLSLEINCIIDKDDSEDEVATSLLITDYFDNNFEAVTGNIIKIISSNQQEAFKQYREFAKSQEVVDKIVKESQLRRRPAKKRKKSSKGLKIKLKR